MLRDTVSFSFTGKERYQILSLLFDRKSLSSGIPIRKPGILFFSEAIDDLEIVNLISEIQFIDR